jgi:hypothetical protein
LIQHSDFIPCFPHVTIRSGTNVLCLLFPADTLDVSSKLEHSVLSVASSLWSRWPVPSGSERTEDFRVPRLSVQHRPLTREQQRAVSNIALIVTLLLPQTERTGITEIVVAKKKIKIIIIPATTYEIIFTVN